MLIALQGFIRPSSAWRSWASDKYESLRLWHTSRRRIPPLIRILPLNMVGVFDPFPLLALTLPTKAIKVVAIGDAVKSGVDQVK